MWGYNYYVVNFIVPLVTQQGQYIQTHTPLSVGTFCGEMGVDNWQCDRWIEKLDDHNVLVMTRQIFLDMLTHKYIHLSRVNLLIFDECHHAVKNDPYVCIMRSYTPLSEHERPHILGLSASIISGKCKPGQLSGKLKALEETLHCRIETARDLSEVAKYATNPDEVLCPYGARPASSSVPVLKASLDSLLEYLGKARHGGDLKSFVEECVYVLEQVSVSSALKAVEMCGTDLSDMHHPLQLKVTLVQQQLYIFNTKCSKILTEGETDYSPKLTKLLEILSSTVHLPRTEKLCGIIFVEQRATAVCLCQVISSESSLSHIRCGYIVGHTGKGGSSVGMNAKKQQNVLSQFRSGSLNLLVATSVVEEGLDVPKCNLVVRYDFPKTFQSYVQSKGRARARNSRYLLVVGDEELSRSHAKLSNYFDLEGELSEVCHERSVPGEDEIERRLRHSYPPYKPFADDGPVISINDSISLLHK